METNDKIIIATASQSSDYNKTDLISILPLDACLRIITLCRPIDIPSLAATSRRFHELCNLDCVWKYVLQSYNCSVSASHLHLSADCRYKHYFQNYFYHLAPLQGLWLINASPYNIVMKIHISPNPYILEASFCCSPLVDKYDKEIKLVSVATVKMSINDISESAISNQLEDSRIRFLINKCESAWNMFNGCFESFYLNSVACKNGIFLFDIDTVKIENNMNSDVYFAERIEMLKNRPPTRPLEVSKIKIPNLVITQPITLIQGIYKGTYASHGIELVLVYYEDNQIIVKKLTGDPNVPGGKISLKCKHYPEPHDYPIKLDVSRYRVYILDTQTVPQKYIACYRGEGQIAHHGFLYPNFCPGFMYVADADTFIFAWDGIMNQISLYKRCVNLSSYAMS